MPRRELATAGVLAQNKMILKVDLYSLISELLCYTCNSPALHLSGCQPPPPPPGQIPDRFLHTNKPGCAEGCKTPLTGGSAFLSFQRCLQGFSTDQKAAMSGKPAHTNTSHSRP